MPAPRHHPPATRVREAAPQDCPAILRLIQGLADYEREPDAVEGGAEQLAAHLFTDAPAVHCHVAEVDEGGGWTVVGIAIWFVTFSTWKVRHGIWLEDLFVEPAFRGLGLGGLLLRALGRICVERGYARLEWWVLDWNTPAHGFYAALGARPQDEWTLWRLDGPALATLGAASAEPPSDRPSGPAMARPLDGPA